LLATISRSEIKENFLQMEGSDWLLGCLTNDCVLEKMLTLSAEAKSLAYDFLAYTGVAN
jgi:hypothetical protein